MLTLLERRRELMAQVASAPFNPTIDDYVQDGLVLWLDGIKNTRSGHSAAATEWEDLSGNNRDYAYGSSAVIGAEYCMPNGSMSSSVSRASSPKTIELCAVISGGTESQMFIPNGNAYGTIWTSYSSGDQRQFKLFFVARANGADAYYIDLSEADNAAIRTYTCDGWSSPANYYVDGALITPSYGKSGAWSTAYNKQLFYYNANYPRPVKSKVYALRIYNRVLSADEIAKNARIDQYRFSL